MLEHYRRFIAFRRNFPALTKGDIEFLAASGHVASPAVAGNERIVCAFNLGSKPAELQIPLSPAEQAVGTWIYGRRTRRRDQAERISGMVRAARVTMQ